jgi:N-acetylneuraminic acid mutarotase
MKGMKEEMKGMKEEMKGEMKEIVMNAVQDAMAGIKDMEVEKKNSNQSSQATCSSDAKENIFVVGGQHKQGRRRVKNKSTECFNWADQTWTLLDSAVFEGCANACSFLYQGQMVVAGGFDGFGNRTNTMKCLNIADPAATWKDFAVNLPVKCSSHKVVNHNDQLFMSGGYVQPSAGGPDKHSDAVYEVQLVPPYASKILTRLPQPISQHGMEMFDQKLFILGGDDGQPTASVVQYDLIKNECKEMPPLPYAVQEMATVLWRNNVLVIGGLDHRYQRLNKLAMYDVITGRSQMMPCMKQKRYGCTAVLTGNVVVVMGGKNENFEDLKSVECFDLERQVWQDLPDMLERRAFATAVVKPNH